MQLDMDNVNVRYGDEMALEAVSFCIHKGEFVGLIGPNGAGKTTMLKVILGLLAPTSGEIMRGHATLGYVPQRGNQYAGAVPMSVAEVVRLGSGGNKDAAREALEKVRMDSYAGRRFTELSGGQQQRVSIAKVLAAGADVLILDEPTTGVDESSQQEFYQLLQDLNKAGTTMLMVSHEVDAVLSLVTRVVCLNRTILYDGTPDHFEADEYLPGTYVKYHTRLHHAHGGVK